MRLFPLSNSDIILGVDWLRQHNPITFDYHNVLVKFQQAGKWITLKGDTNDGSIQIITGKKLSKLLRATKGVSEGYLCMMTSSLGKDVTTEETVIHPRIAQVLELQ